MTTDIARALSALVPGCEYRVIDNDYDQITWFDSNSVACPTKSAVDAKLADLTTEDNANTHQGKRRPEYPSIGDQLDDLYKAGAFSTEMTNKIKAIKDKYPKPS